MPTTRPEFENPPEIYYNAVEARKYTVSTRVRHIQRMMTLRALELLNLPRTTSSGPTLSSSAALGSRSAQEGALLLDVGCGSGISGEVLTEQGHAWVGVDISRDMLHMAKENEQMVPVIEQKVKGGAEEEEGRRRQRPDDLGGSVRQSASGVEEDSPSQNSPLSSAEDDDGEEEDSEDSNASDAGAAMNDGVAAAPSMSEVIHLDIGTGLPLRPGSFDGCISISVLQWLCHSSKRGEVPQRRLRAFFQSLYNALRRGAKAVLQFYPSSPEQVDMIAKAAMKCGFNGGVVVDFPHSTRAKKHYLVVQAGQVAGFFVPPPALGGDGLQESSLYDADGGSEATSNDSEREEVEDDSWRNDRARVGGRDREMTKRSRSEHRSQQSRKRRRRDNRPVTGTKEWVLLKKAERRRRGERTTEDTKYTMRKRKPRF